MTWNCNVTTFPFKDSRRIIKELHVGDDVTVVTSTFKVCINLQKVVLGKKVSQLSAEAFKGTKIKEFYIMGDEVPSCESDVFLNVTLNDATLYVPANQVHYCQTTEPWSGFGQIVAHTDDEVGIKTINTQPSLLNAPIYDLNGLRTSLPANGLYIINGKKYMKK